MLFYRQYFAILPFRYDSNENEEKYPFHPSFVVRDNEIDANIKNVVDFTFLYGYLEPTLAILYEPEQTVVGYFYLVILDVWHTEKILFL